MARGPLTEEAAAQHCYHTENCTCQRTRLSALLSEYFGGGRPVTELILLGTNFHYDTSSYAFLGTRALL